MLFQGSQEISQIENLMKFMNFNHFSSIQVLYKMQLYISSAWQL